MKNQNGFAYIILIVLFVVIGTIVYLGIRQNSDKFVVPVSTLAPEATIKGNVPGWRTFTTKDGKYSLSYPPDWTLTDESKELDLYQDGKFQLSQHVLISKNGYTLESRNPLAWGPGVCLFPDSPKFEGPSSEFGDFVEFKTATNTYRRPKTSIAQSGTANLRLPLCAREPASGNFVSVAGFGVTSYQTPPKYDEKVITVMDQILSTFKFTDPGLMTNWKTYTNIQYGYSIDYPSNWSTANIAAGNTAAEALPNSIMVDIKTDNPEDGMVSVQVLQSMPTKPNGFTQSQETLGKNTFVVYTANIENMLSKDYYLDLKNRHYLEILMRPITPNNKQIFKDLLSSIKKI